MLQYDVPVTIPLLAATDVSNTLMHVPVAVWLIAVGVLAILFRLVQLRLRQQASPDSSGAAHLAALHAALRQYADAHLGRLPRSLAELGLPEGDVKAIVYRAVPTARADEKTLLAHDSAAATTVLEFPHLRPARHVLFWSGRVRLVSESAFEKLIEADDAFRDKHGIAPPHDAEPPA